MNLRKRLPTKAQDIFSRAVAVAKWRKHICIYIYIYIYVLMHVYIYEDK